MDTTINVWLMRVAGLDPTAASRSASASSSSCEFKASAAFPEPLEVGLRAGRLGTTSVTWELGILRERRAARREGRFVHVFVDDESRRPVPIPDGIRAAIERDLRRLIRVAYRPGGMTTCHPERWSTMTRRMPDPARARRGTAGGVLRREHPDVVGDGTLSARVIAGGRSNLTYRVDGGLRPLVVRRPPLGHVQTTAHDMAREHRVITALQGSRVPVPPTVALVDDTDGAAVPAPSSSSWTSCRAPCSPHPSQNTTYTADELRAVSLELATLLAELHAIDPAAVGLADLGRADGYLDRQLRTLADAVDGSRSRPVPALDDLQERLAERVPTTRRSSIVHGDYRLDNVLVAVTGDAPRITRHPRLGDGDARRLRRRPRACSASTGTSADLEGGGGVAPSAVDPAAGYPEFDELVDAYAPAWAAASRSSAGTGRSPRTSSPSSSRASTSGSSRGDTVGDGLRPDRRPRRRRCADEGLAQLAGVVR